MNAPLDRPQPETDVELLRFATAGSVDDGKSTLIGRLLFDAKALFDDQLEQLDARFDLASLTDGLRAERERGITIDVAYRYFATPRRRFIVADCPGHLEYTRNAFTGMSTADVALLLVDVRHGVVAQTRRHTFLAGLLGLGRVVFCVNKMDLVGYDEARFRALRDDLRALARGLGVPNVSVVPVSALAGDNVTDRSTQMPWYDGPTLLSLLETLPAQERRDDPARMPVQCVLADGEGRSRLAGLVSGGPLRTGEPVTVSPSGLRTVVASIATYDGPLDEAADGQSVTLRLADDVAVRRGDVIAPAAHAPVVARRLACTLCWMAERPVVEGSQLEVKIGTKRVVATLSRVSDRFDFEAHRYRPGATQLELNDVARIELVLAEPTAVDRHHDQRDTGRMLVIDPQTRDTLGAALVDDALVDGVALDPPSP